MKGLAALLAALVALCAADCTALAQVEEPRPMFGPDLRDGRKSWAILIELLAMSGEIPVGGSVLKDKSRGTGLVTRPGWSFIVGFGLFDFIDLIVSLEAGWVGLDADDAPTLGRGGELDARVTVRLGAGGRITLLRIGDVIIYAGAEVFSATSSVRYEETEYHVTANLRAKGFGPLAGARWMLAEFPSGSGVALAFDVHLDRASRTLEINTGATGDIFESSQLAAAHAEEWERTYEPEPVTWHFGFRAAIVGRL